VNNPNPLVGRTLERRLAYKWKVLISVVFGIFMVILDGTVVNVALQTLREEFNVSLADAQWIISIYILALGVTTPLSGFLADRFGIKKVYIAGLALFVCGSLLCGLAPTLGLLIAARVLQGIGGGLAQPLGPALLYRAFPPQEQGVALGYFGIALVVAPAFGPVLGGLLVQHGLWRAIFFINVPIGIIGVALATRFLRHQPPERRPTLDPLGIATAVLAFGALLYAASNAADLGWAAATGTLAPLAWVLFAIIVAWTPPHFWALALIRRADYARAGVPMLPVVSGDQATRWQLLVYSVALTLISLIPVVLGWLGAVYGAAALALGGLLIAAALRLIRQPTGVATWRLYTYSLLYLALLFTFMAIDHVSKSFSRPSRVRRSWWKTSGTFASG
jgi:multidrug resistance protein